MTHPGDGRFVARWSAKERGALVITDIAGHVVDSRTVPLAGDLPYPQMLWQTGWVPYPGSEWQEEPPGQWSRAVFPDTEMGGKP
jgi:hypothetical protein